MEIAEIRDLDGPNLFLRQPAIKLELAPGERAPCLADELIDHVLATGELPAIGKLPKLNPATPERFIERVSEIVGGLHDLARVPRPSVVTRAMEAPGHVAVAFGWRHRGFGRRVARTAFDLASGRLASLDVPLVLLHSIATDGLPDEQRPEFVRDADRVIPTIAVTGTNGKTTTTRLISSILMHAGKRVGWTSSAGVVIQGEIVLPGDYTGPAGARRVFDEPDLDIAVLETARGGILLRGLGYESNDVSVVTNVSADHLGLHGVHSVEELARVKSIVPAVTKPDGYAVLNADDDLAFGMRDVIAAKSFLISREPANPHVRRHREAGGSALWVDGSEIRFGHGDAVEALTRLDDIPITFGGRATHMLENALCAAAACLAIGLSPEQVRDGLAQFRNESNQNRGRLNVFDVDGATVIVDFAHNLEGLRHLLVLGRGFVVEGGRLIAVVGTAGDRPDDAFVEIGRLAGESAEVVITKDTAHYLRGRALGETIALLDAGVAESGCRLHESVPGELDAVLRAIEIAVPGDVVAVMCVDEPNRVLARIEEIGRPVS